MMKNTGYAHPLSFIMHFVSKKNKLSTVQRRGHCYVLVSFKY